MSNGWILCDEHGCTEDACLCVPFTDCWQHCEALDAG
jgi:hypothetical protein